MVNWLLVAALCSRTPVLLSGVPVVSVQGSLPNQRTVGSEDTAQLRHDGKGRSSNYLSVVLGKTWLYKIYRFASKANEIPAVH